MTDLAPEPGTQPEREAQYAIYVPVKNHDGIEMPELLPKIRKSLTRAGIKGRSVIRGVEGDWEDYAIEPMDVILIVAPDNERTDATIHGIAVAIQELAGQEAVFITKSPVESWLITGPGVRPPEQIESTPNPDSPQV